MVADSHLPSLEPGLVGICALLNVQVKYPCSAAVSSMDMVAVLELLSGKKDTFHRIYLF